MATDEPPEPDPKNLNPPEAPPEQQAGRSGPRSKHLAIIEAIKARPTRANIRYDDAKAALVGIGCEFYSRGGSKIAFTLGREELYFDRPHPSPTLKKSHVKLIREFLVLLGY